MRFLIRSACRQGSACGRDEDCADRVFRCRQCGYSSPDELDACPQCNAGWKAIDVSHGPNCPRHLLDEAMDTPNGLLVRRCFRLLNARTLGLTLTLSDITEEEFRVMELIDSEQKEYVAAEDRDVKSFQELLIRKLSRR